MPCPASVLLSLLPPGHFSPSMCFLPPGTTFSMLPRADAPLEAILDARPVALLLILPNPGIFSPIFSVHPA